MMAGEIGTADLSPDLGELVASDDEAEAFPAPVRSGQGPILKETRREIDEDRLTELEVQTAPMVDGYHDDISVIPDSQPPSELYHKAHEDEVLSQELKCVPPPPLPSPLLPPLCPNVYRKNFTRVRLTSHTVTCAWTLIRSST